MFFANNENLILRPMRSKNIFNSTLNPLLAIISFFIFVYFFYFNIEFISLNNINYPVFDYWRMFTEAVSAKESGDYFKYIFSRINEHLTAGTFSAILVDYFFFNLNLNFLRFVHYSSFIALIFSLLFLHIKIFYEFDRYKINWTSIFMLSLFCLFSLLSLRTWEVHYGYTVFANIQFFLFYTLSHYLYNQRCNSYFKGVNVSNTSLLLVVLLCLLCQYSVAIGIFALPSIFALSILRSAPKKESILLFLLCFFYIFLYTLGLSFDSFFQSFSNGNNLSHVIENQGLFSFSKDLSLFRPFYFMCLMIGSFWIPSDLIFIYPKYLIFIFGFFGIFLSGILFRIFLIGKYFNSSSFNTLFALLFISLTYALMVGLTRSHMIDEQAMVSRYMLTSGIFWSCLLALSYFIIYMRYPLKRHSINTVFLIAIIILSIRLVVTQRAEFNFFKLRTSNVNNAVLALKFGINDDKFFPWLQILGVKNFYTLLDIYRSNKTSIYADPLLGAIGLKLPEGITINDRVCSGNISQFDIIDITSRFYDKNGIAIKLSGDIAYNSSLTTSNIILIADQNSIVRGLGNIESNEAGLIDRLYNDGNFTFDNPKWYNRVVGKGLLLNYEWTAYSVISNKQEKLKAYLFNKESNLICPLKEKI